MESATETNSLRYQKFLPYWAVLQTDLRQTFRSWIYRLWVSICILATLLYLFYRFGIHSEAWLIQSAAIHTSQLIRGIILGSLALIVIITVSGISSERGTLADSVLSRGISRYQYFLAKWHARSFVIVTTFTLVASIMLIGSHFLLSEDLTLAGSLFAIVTLSSVLCAICTWGITIGAMTNSTIFGITLLWIGLYSGGFLLTLLPGTLASPERLLQRLPLILRGQYDVSALTDWIAISLFSSLVAAGIGMWAFARKDV